MKNKFWRREFMHTPPVSPSSYNVKPSIWRYPWKRSLFTHDDKLASSYSATQRQKCSEAVNTHAQKKKKKRPLTFSTQPVYIKSKVEARIDAWMVRRSRCLPPVDSLGNKDRDTSCASIHRGLLNNDQKWL